MSFLCCPEMGGRFIDELRMEWLRFLVLMKVRWEAFLAERSAASSWSAAARAVCMNKPQLCESHRARSMSVRKFNEPTSHRWANSEQVSHFLLHYNNLNLSWVPSLRACLRDHLIRNLPKFTRKHRNLPKLLVRQRRCALQNHECVWILLIAIGSEKLFHHYFTPVTSAIVELRESQTPCKQTLEWVVKHGIWLLLYALLPNPSVRPHSWTLVSHEHHILLIAPVTVTKTGVFLNMS